MKESPVNSDGKVSNISDMDDSEDGAIPEPVIKKGKGKQKRKLAAKKKQEADLRKQKVEENLDRTQHVEIPEQANIHALCRRSREQQPPSSFQHLPQQVREWYYCFTSKQVKNSLIIQDPKKRVRVHLFPQATIPSNLLPLLGPPLKNMTPMSLFQNVIRPIGGEIMRSGFWAVGLNQDTFFNLIQLLTIADLTLAKTISNLLIHTTLQ